MGGRDKGLIPFRGRPLVAWVMERLTPQVQEVLISANRHREAYAALGVPVLPDTLGAGPLAGIFRGLEAAAFPHLLVVPCDAPFLPGDLASRLFEALKAHDVPLAIPDEGRLQPLFALLHQDLLPGLREALARGDYRAEAWMTSHPHVRVAFPDPDAFANLNAPEDLRRWA